MHLICSQYRQAGKLFNIYCYDCNKGPAQTAEQMWMNEIPVFVLTGTDKCAMAALQAYAAEARRLNCKGDFIVDLESNVIPDFKDFQQQEPEKVKLPD